MEYLTYIGIFIVGYGLGKILTVNSLLERMASNPDAVIAALAAVKASQDEELNDDPEHTQELTCEQYHGFAYLFSIPDNRFIAQGPTVDEALAKAKQQYPQYNYKISNTKDHTI